MLRTIKRRFLTGRGLGRRKDRPIVTGDLELFGLSEIIQFLSMGKKTAMVELNRGYYGGRIWFFDGKATHATTDTAEGQAAFFETVCWNTGNFIIEYGITSDKQTLFDDTMYLFMEGLRRIDESRNELAMERAAETPTLIVPDPEPEQEVLEYVEPDDQEYEQAYEQVCEDSQEQVYEPLQEPTYEQTHEETFEDAELTAMTDLIALNAPAQPLELSNDMHSELFEAIDEVNQFIELEAQGFVVAGVVESDPLPPSTSASVPEPDSSVEQDSELPAEVLALHQALDNQ
jgi:hypothetical protein